MLVIFIVYQDFVFAARRQDFFHFLITLLKASQVFISGFFVSPLLIFWIVKYETPLLCASVIKSADDIEDRDLTIAFIMLIPYFYTVCGTIASVHR